MLATALKSLSSITSRAGNAGSKIIQPPKNFWQRFRNGASLTNDTQTQQLLTPINFMLRQGERYYQEIAINRAVEAN